MQNNLKETFEQVLEDNKHRIYRICKIYAQPPLEPQDLFQEVVIQVWKNLSTFKGKSNISTWIYRIALNVCHSSKTKLQKKNSKTDRLDSILFTPTETPSQKQDDERYRALRSCIASLKEGDKSIVVLYLEELPYKEIAQVIGLTENHVAVKMKRIRKLLFDCITTKIK